MYIDRTKSESYLQSFFLAAGLFVKKEDVRKAYKFLLETYNEDNATIIHLQSSILYNDYYRRELNNTNFIQSHPSDVYKNFTEMLLMSFRLKLLDDKTYFRTFFKEGQLDRYTLIQEDILSKKLLSKVIISNLAIGYIVPKTILIRKLRGLYSYIDYLTNEQKEEVLQKYYNNIR